MIISLNDKEKWNDEGMHSSYHFAFIIKVITKEPTIR